MVITYETVKTETHTIDMYEVHPLVNSSMEPLDLSAKTVEKSHRSNIALKISPKSVSDEKSAINVLNKRPIRNRTLNKRTLSMTSITNENITSSPPSHYDSMNNLSRHHPMNDITLINYSSPPAHTYNNIDLNGINYLQVAKNNSSCPQEIDDTYLFLQEEQVEVICTPDIAFFDDSMLSSSETEHFEASSDQEPEVKNNYIEVNINTTKLPLSRPRYKCKSCGKLYLYLCSLLKHQNFCSPYLESSKVTNEYKCATCNKICKSIPTWQYHIKTHFRQYSCQICGKLFSLKWLLTVHSRIHTGEKPFKCIFCNKAFSDKANLASHMPVHDPARKYYQCQFCKKTYARIQSLKIHKCANDEKKNFFL